jgi:sigma-54-specific transcriptional regulator
MTTFSAPITEALFHEFRSPESRPRAPQVLTFPEPRALSLSIRATALVFEDPRSQALFSRLERIAPSEASVLVIGETGTGKELVARQLHALSRRAAGPFVAVNCAALPESLIESELFGHEKGAFTGAVQAKAGWFESANGGTLFLDEIGDLPLSVQVKLLRVLQEREIVRVGSRQPSAIDVRLVAATNVNLDQAVRAGTFREDLYYRLNVAPLDLPPLRERPGDILPLVQHFIRVYTARLGRGEVALSQEAARRLQDYEWPGNIRELENVVHHALLVCSGGLVKPADLHFSSSAFHHRRAEAAPGEAQAGELREVLLRMFEQAPPNLMDIIQETLIRAAYEYCENNQVHSARLLDISRNILRARLARYGLIGPAEKAERAVEDGLA